MVLSIAVPTDQVNVVIVDDHEVTRRGIKASLSHDPSIRVVGEAATSWEAITLITELKPDVALVDVRLGEGSGIEVSTALKEVASPTKILVLSAYDDDQYVKAFARLGVSGYLVKTTSSQDLRRAVHDAAEGWLVFTPTIAPKVRDILKQGDSASSQPLSCSAVLTPREAEVLRHVAGGLRNGEVAKKMNLAVKTVEAHLQNASLKLNARTRTEAVVTAMQRGWL